MKARPGDVDPGPESTVAPATSSVSSSAPGLASAIVDPARARAGRRLAIDVPRWALPLLRPMRLKGVSGGRGGTKSHTTMELQLLEYIKNPDFNVVFIREVQKSIKDSVYQLIKDKIKLFKLSKHFHVKTTEICATKGTGRMLFMGMNDQTAAALKSLEGMDRAIFEEAQTASQPSIETLLPTIRKAHSEIWFLWNPKRKTDPVDKLFASLLPHEGIHLKVNYLSNRHASDALIAEAERCKRTDPDRYKHIWLGGYEEHSEARIFKHLITGERFEFPLGMTRRFGLDWGFGDPMVGLSGWATISQDGLDRHLYIRYGVYEPGVEISDTKSFLMAIPEAAKWVWTAGRERPERIKDLRKQDIKIKACVGGNGSELEGVEYLQDFTIHLHANLPPEIVEEFENYKHPVDKLTGKILPTLPAGKNHSVEAGRYMVEDMRIFERDATDDKPVDPTPIPTRHKWGGRRGR